MSERLGKVALGFDTLHPLSEETAEIIDDEIALLIREAYARARTILLAHRDGVDRLASELLRHSTLDGEELERAFLADAPDAPPMFQ
jgi:cell division protease FtsH